MAAEEAAESIFDITYESFVNCFRCRFAPWQFLVLLLFSFCAGEDYYELLGVSRSADNREIRKAFKKLAVKLHPDKNKDDPDAHASFVRLTKAYETLKDEETRKKYDLYGEEGVKTNTNQNYHSWSYYHDNFGIYDDDPEIITLNRADFEQSVVNSNSLWFINFYSAMCSHCHHLAPAWRQLARDLEGVVRIGAVNCEEDWAVCRMENVRSYPSLIMYPSGERYSGERSTEEMEKYVLKKLNVNIVDVTARNWDALRLREDVYRDKPWLLFLCYDDEECADRDTRVKVAAILEGLVVVGLIDCGKETILCTKLGGDANVIFWEHAGNVPDGVINKISSSEFKEIARQTLSFLPEAAVLDYEGFEDMRSQLRSGSPYPWLVYFYIGFSGPEDLELKKLPALLSSSMRIGKVHCGQEVALCQEMHISRYPVFAVFKPGGGYELYHGRETAHDIANFAEESSSATNMWVLTPDEFPEMVLNNAGSSSGAWFVDFYAPWCPPCMRLLPEFRKASRHFESNVNFGTVDCTVHAALCQQHNIRSYPTTIFYNKSIPHHFHGGHTENDLVDFVEDVLHPTVTKLNELNFYKTVGEKTPNEIWMVDFFAPWCGPCQQLSPQWRKLAKSVAYLPNVHIGEVNCQTESFLCDQQGVRSYPTIRLYPMGTKGLSSFAIFSGYHRDSRTLLQWLYNFLPSSVEELNTGTFLDKLRGSKEPWLVDFYAPWCGHCVAFAPEFQRVAHKFEGKIRAGKVNCDAYRELCHQAGVSAYPTILLYRTDQKTVNSYRGEEIHSQSADFIISYLQRVLDHQDQEHISHEQQEHVPHDEF